MNLFADDVFSGNLSTAPTLPSLYEREMDRLTELVEESRQRRGLLGKEAGGTAMLISRQAGAGKSHLLARFASERRSQAHSCPIELHDVDDLCWEEWLHQLVRSVHESKHSQGDHSVLTGRAAYLLANATGALVSEGRIPCASPATASQWLLENSVKLFDYAERDNSSVAWFRSEFPRLLPEIAKRYALEWKLDAELLASRLEWLYNYASLSASEHPLAERRRVQAELLNEGQVFAANGEASAKQDWCWLGRVISEQSSLVLTLDDLDWTYRDEAVALRIARMLSECSRMLPNGLSLISVNEDTWKETFEKGLPQAALDRLTAFVVRLEGVPRALWRSFLDVHADSVDVEIDREKLLGRVEQANPDQRALMPRKLLRVAAEEWGRLEAADLPKVFVKPDVGEKRSQEPWTHAMVDLRNLIRSRGETATPPNPAPARELTPFIEVADSQDSTQVRDKKPALTPEFRSFLKSLRARATDKEGYLPQPTTAEERARERSQLILHGREQEGDKASTTASEAKVEKSNGETRPEAIDYAVKLRELKLRFAETGGQAGIQMPRLRRLIHRAGCLFPAITQEVRGLSGDPLAELRWAFQQSEVNFGFRPFADADYWRQLVVSTAARARNLRETNKMRVKLAVFGRTRDSEEFPSWKIGEDGGADLQYCDLILLTDHQLISIYAIDELLATEIAPDQHEPVFAKISGDIDFFWKMITRPVWTLVSPVERSMLS